MTQAQQLANLSQAYTAGALGFRNLLQNPCFRVNQRNYPSGTGWPANTVTLDRWKNVSAGQGIVYALTSNAYTVTAPATGMEQVIEGLEIIGGDYCLYWQGTATATVNGAAVAKAGKFTLPANTNATVRFSGGTVYQPQLERGSVPTTFEFRPFMTELQMCQRFLPAFVAAGSNGAIIGQGYVNTSTSAVIFVRFPVRCRAVPTACISQDAAGNAAAGILTLYYLGATAQCNGASFNPTTDVDTACMTPSVPGGLTGGQAIAMGLNTAGARLLFLGAEL